MEARLTKAERVINRGAENINNSRDTIIEGTVISGEGTIVETGSITGTPTGTHARTDNKGVNDVLADMTAPEDFNESTTEAMTDITDEN